MSGISLEGTYNFRDLGGLPLVGGGTTVFGALYRSDALGELTPQGVRALEESSIEVIVDLRTEEERGLAPDRLPTSRPLQIVDLPLLDGAVSSLSRGTPDGGGLHRAAVVASTPAPDVPSLGSMYLAMLENGGASFAALARLVGASMSSSSLVHCTAGKDRTGVASALLLDAVGVTRDAIVADYVCSQQNLAGPWTDSMFARAAQYGIPLTTQIRALISETPADAIEMALMWIDSRGGSRAYLEDSGLTASELLRLEARLVNGASRISP